MFEEQLQHIEKTVSARVDKIDTMMELLLELGEDDSVTITLRKDDKVVTETVTIKEIGSNKDLSQLLNALKKVRVRSQGKIADALKDIRTFS